MLILRGLLPYPGPGLMRRLTGLFVCEETLNRMAVLGQTGPGGQKVTITDRLVVLFVRMTVVYLSAPGEPALWESVLMVVIPESVNRLAAGPGGWKVTITN